MTATSLNGPAGVCSARGIPLVLAVQHFRGEPPVDNKVATAAWAVSKPASGARDQGPAALAVSPQVILKPKSLARFYFN